MSWIRVSSATPCPICNRIDWCLVASDGDAAVCKRIESPKPFGKDAGYFHRLNESDRLADYVPRSPRQNARSKKSRTPQEWSHLANYYFSQMADRSRDALAKQLGLMGDSLRWLRVGWSSKLKASTWPMRDAAGNLVGVRTRLADGSKRAIKGTDGNGLFFVTHAEKHRRFLSSAYLIVCEGPSDTAAVLDSKLGSVVGLPSCTGGFGYVQQLVAVQNPHVILLVPDRDAAGLAGFSKLAERLVSSGFPQRRLDAMTPPEQFGDLRAWRIADIQNLTDTIVSRLASIADRAELTGVAA